MCMRERKKIRHFVLLKRHQSVASSAQGIAAIHTTSRFFGGQYSLAIGDCHFSQDPL